MRPTLGALLVCVLIGAFVGCSPDAPDAGAVDEARLRAAGDEPESWLSYGGSDAEQRYSRLASIHAKNVGGLGLAWYHDLETNRGLEASPIVVDGTLYTTSTWSRVYAFDAKTGELRWSFDPEVSREYGQRACCDVVNRGVAVYEGRVYFGSLDGRLFALDAATGEPDWEVLTVDREYPYTITGAPRIVKGKVFIGNGGAELGVRGYVSAYDAKSGELVWRFFTVPGDPSQPFEHPELEAAARTWTGQWWTMGGGGTAWDAMAYDPKLDLLYVGTGNGSPWNRRVRSPDGGDNLFLSSILALRPDTGELVWHYQTTPGDTWDFTATQHILLADLEIAGKSRKVLMQAPKNGFFYVLDRETGELLSAEKYVTVTWADRVDLATGRPVEVEGARYPGDVHEQKPGAYGGHNWHPMSFNPDTGLVYIPAQEIPYWYKDDPAWEYRPGAWNLGIDWQVGDDFPPDLVSGHLLAWDPVTQKEAWRAQYAGPWNGGTLTTAGNLVFQGTAHGTLVAYRATDGEKLFETTVGTGVIAPPVTYSIDGEQHVAVMAGWGGAFALAAGRAARAALADHAPGRLLVFKLGGQEELPFREVAKRELAAIDIEIDAAQVDHGLRVYHHWCSICHGPGVISGGALPDLRMSKPDVYDGLEDVVLRGALRGNGMPAFERWLEADDVAALRAYMLSRRAALLAEGEPPS